MVQCGTLKHAKLQSNHHHQHSSIFFLQAESPSWCPTSSIKAVKANYYAYLAWRNGRPARPNTQGEALPLHHNPQSQVWRQSTALTWSRWGCRWLADNIWLLAHDNNNNCTTKGHESKAQVLHISHFHCFDWLTVLVGWPESYLACKILSLQSAKFFRKPVGLLFPDITPKFGWIPYKNRSELEQCQEKQ